MSSILKVDTIQTAAGGTPTAADLGLNVSGSVLQVQSATKTNWFSTTSTTFVNITDLVLSITPKSTSSKILVMSKLVVGWDTSLTKVYAGLARNGTLIDGGTDAGRVSAGFEHYGTDPHHAFVGNLQIMDTPATTSSVTYSAQIRTQSAGTVYCNRSQNFRANAPDYDGTLSSTITVIEFAG